MWCGVPSLTIVFSLSPPSPLLSPPRGSPRLSPPSSTLLRPRPTLPTMQAAVAGTVRSTCTLRPHPPRAKKREMQRRERKRRCYRHKADYSPALSNHYLTHPRATALHSPSPSARRRLLFQGRPDGRAERQTAAPAGGRTTVGCRRTGSRGRRDRRERFVFRICRARGRCANGRRRKLRRWRGGRRCIGRCIPVSPYLPESSNVWPLASWV